MEKTVPRRRISFWDHLSSRLFHKSPSLSSLPSNKVEIPAIRINSNPFLSQEEVEDIELVRSSSLDRATIRRPILRKQNSFDVSLVPAPASVPVTLNTPSPHTTVPITLLPGDSDESPNEETGDESISEESQSHSAPLPTKQLIIPERKSKNNDLVLTAGRGRLRLFSHPNFTTRSRSELLLPQTAPILQNSFSANPMKFLPAYFRRLSQVSGVCI